MAFTDIDVKPEYRSLSDDVVRDFYIPLLDEAILYKRAVGYFSSTALIEISKGITGLVRNGGKILLVSSPYLSDNDLEAINKGFELRHTVFERAILASITEPRNIFEERRLNLLANLVADGRLEIKIAFTETEGAVGMFHEKMGLMYDKEHNIVAFSGSMNETNTAFSYNYESIDVFCSWTADKRRVDAKERAFLSLWNNGEPNVEIMDFPDVAREAFQQYCTNEIDLDIDKRQYEKRKNGYGVVRESDVENSSMSVIPEIPRDVVLHDYQKEAIEVWKQQDFVGIFDMATGTGKTYTGLGAIVQLYNHTEGKLSVVIVCPYQHLVEQWVDDIERFKIKPIVGYSASPQKDWRNRLEDAILDQKLNVRGKEFFCFICTNATFSSNSVQTQLGKIRGDILLVVDEAHNFGATRLSTLLSDRFRYRLALSATIERHHDLEGTEKLFRYFGAKCIEYPLERAIQEGKLTRYKYYPIITNLHEVEMQRYSELTHEMGKCVLKDKNGRISLSERGKMLAIKRARLVAGAEDKIDKLRDHILPYVNDKHILVYCGATNIFRSDHDHSDTDEEDLRQIDAVTDLLGNQLGMKVSQFTSREDINEREVLKREFADGETLQALIAIKCLDEGVNIPEIKRAFILASTTNPKEYIQRRGRVLRLANGKDYAEIYDFIALPRPLDEVSSLTQEQLNRELTLVKNELARAEEFSRVAMNMVEAESILQEIRDAYVINESLITFKEDFVYDG